MNRKGFVSGLIIGIIALIVIAAAVGWYFVAREHAAVSATQILAYALAVYSTFQITSSTSSY